MQRIVSALSRGVAQSTRSSTAVRSFSSQVIPNILDEQTAKFGHRDILRDGEQQLRQTHNELKTQVDAFAAGLVDLGWQPGDRLGFLMSNKLEQAVLFLACARAGIVSVPLAHPLSEEQLGNHINHFNLYGIIFDDPIESTHYQNHITSLLPEVDHIQLGDYPRSLNYPSLKYLISTGHDERPNGFHFLKHLGVFHDEQDTASRLPVQRIMSSLSKDAPVLEYNVGTLDAPKTATYTHGDVIDSANAITKKLNLTLDDHLVSITQPGQSPLAWASTLVASLSNGVNYVIPSSQYDASATLTALNAEQARVLVGGASDIGALAAEPEFASAADSVKTVVTDGQVSGVGSAQILQYKTSGSGVSLA